MIYYILLQIKQIVPFWILGLIIGAVVSAYKEKLILHIPYEALEKAYLIPKCILAALIGALSPITMYGTLPILAAFARLKIKQSVISSFLITSIMINPNVFIFSFSLGADIAMLRLFLSVLAGVGAGLLVELMYKDKSIYDMNGFEVLKTGGGKGNEGFAAIAESFRRGLLRTAPNLALGIVLAALFEVYMPKRLFNNMFGADNGLGVLFAASMGVAAYYCGGGTIPLILAWINEGMSLGAAMAFMITGPATKLTNLTAVKTIMPAKTFSLYIIYNIALGIAAGFLIDMIGSLVK